MTKFEIFLKYWIKIEIFVEVYKNRDYSKILTKIKTFVIFHEKRNFLKFWSKSGFFLNSDLNSDLQKCEQNRDFS